MEERANANKEKKYVLYTVVGEEKERAGVGVWVVRVLLGTLLLIALAVVPYVSLRLAQVNDRTLVVFQPVLVHNRSKDHSVAHKSVHNSMTSSRPGSVGVTHALKSASLIKNIHETTEESFQNDTKKQANATIITVHESAVTLSFIEDTTNNTKSNNSIDIASGDAVENDFNEENNVTFVTSEPPKDIKDETSSAAPSSTSENPVVDVKIKSNDQATTQASDNSNISSKVLISTVPSEIVTPKVPLVYSLKSSSSTVIPRTTHAVHKVSHKLAYVATATSGNHVGGVCIWKTNKNITNWSYFYDNIPIEYQSHQDSVDRELRAMLVAVRRWSDMWYDYHVVLRSQNEAINGSKHPMYKQLLEEIDNRSINHFTYEMEWRFQREDSLVKMAYSLSRLYKSFKYWMGQFNQTLHTVVGEEHFGSVHTLKEKREQIPQELFATKDMEIPKESGDLESLFR